MASPDNTDSNSTREQRRGRDGDPMITLNDAITKRFPQGNEWASEALAALNPDELSPREALEALYRLKAAMDKK